MSERPDDSVSAAHPAEPKGRLRVAAGTRHRPGAPETDAFLIMDLASGRSYGPEPQDLTLPGRSVVLAVLDGNGQHGVGRSVALLAASAIFEQLRASPHSSGDEAPAERLHRAIAAANEVVCERGSAPGPHRGCGATATVAYVEDDVVHIAHVGDSRAYVAGENGVTLKTRDQTLGEALLDQGQLSLETLDVFPHRHVLTDVLGKGATIHIASSSSPFRRGERLLLCTDGLSDRAEDEILGMHRQAAEPAAIRDALLEVALARNTDAATVIVVSRLNGPQAP